MTFEEMIRDMKRRQAQDIRRLASVMAGKRYDDLERMRQRHNGFMQQLAEQLLDVTLPAVAGASENIVGRLTEIIDACNHRPSDGLHILSLGTESAWEILIAAESEIHIERFTNRGENETRFNLLEMTALTIRSWILITETIINRTPPVAMALPDHVARHLRARNILSGGSGPRHDPRPSAT